MRKMGYDEDRKIVKGVSMKKGSRNLLRRIGLERLEIKGHEKELRREGGREHQDWQKKVIRS